ncbi:MAG: four helix bundle protein [Adhaeribacter sp.]
MENNQDMAEKENIIVRKSFEFALSILEYTEELENNRKNVIANQLLKSGTSIGANIREAQQAESRADFIHKLKIAAKEAEETEYWLLLCHHSSGYPEVSNRLEKLLEIKKLLSRIIVTSKRNN